MKKTMRKSILMICLMAVFGISRAMAGATMTVSEIYYNEAYDFWGIDIGIENDGVPVTAFQCDVAIGENFAFSADSTNNYLYAFTGRAMTQSGLGGQTPTHMATFARRPNGTLCIVVYSTANTVFGGDGGTVMFLALNKHSEFSDELPYLPYSVNLTNQVLAYVDGDKVKSIYPDGIVNNPYLTCYDSMGNNVVLFAMGGYDTADGIYTDLDYINKDLQTNDRVVSVNMLYMGEYYVDNYKLMPKNPNALIYTLSPDLFIGNTENKLYMYGDYDMSDGVFWHCDNMQLYDEGLSFEFSYDAYSAYGSRAEVKEFSFDRDFPGGQWSTVVLPISLSDEQLAAIKDSGVKVARLARYDEAEGAIFYEEVDKFEANTPYLIRPEETCRVFDMLTDVPLLPTDTVGVVAAGALTMHGNYDHTLISSTAESWRYGYDVSTGEFVKIGNNCVLGPFRCYLELPVAQTANAKSRIRIADGVADGIESIGDDDKPRGPVYSVDGRRVLDGGRLGDIRRLPAGVYIVDGRKIVVK